MKKQFNKKFTDTLLGFLLGLFLTRYLMQGYFALLVVAFIMIFTQNNINIQRVGKKQAKENNPWFDHLLWVLLGVILAGIGHMIFS